MTKAAPKTKKTASRESTAKNSCDINLAADLETQAAQLKKEHPQYTGALNEAANRDRKSNTGYLKKTITRILVELASR